MIVSRQRSQGVPLPQDHLNHINGRWTPPMSGLRLEREDPAAAGTIGTEARLPLGRTRGAGNGHRKAGQAALGPYSKWKTVYAGCSGRLKEAQTDR